MDWPQSNGPNQIKDLNLVFHHRQRTPEFCSWIVRQCPNLVRLHWTDVERGPKRAMDQLAHYLQADPLFGKRLEDIALKKMIFRNGHFRRLMGSLTLLRRLDLASTNFDHELWMILRTTQPSHLQTLTVLNLERCRRLSGEAIHQMLCEMPNLEIFKATRVVDKAIMEDSRPWVCLGMEELKLELLLTPLSADSSFRSLVLQRYLALLSQLKRLETLTHFLPRDENGSIELLKIEKGLDTLKGLRRLRFADWMIHYKGENDKRWLRETWPRLETPSPIGIGR